jgi:hypothetical protein
MLIRRRYASVRIVPKLYRLDRFSYRGIPGLNLSGLFQQATSFAYTSPQSKPVTSITFQPLLIYQLGRV